MRVGHRVRPVPSVGAAVLCIVLMSCSTSASPNVTTTAVPSGADTSSSQMSGSATPTRLAGRIVFSLTNRIDDPTSGQIAQVMADGSGYAVVTAAGYLDIRPNLSPDGTTVVFGRGSNGECSPVGSCDIWSVPVSGGTPSQLTSCDPEKTCLGNFDATWSNDGKQIIFTSDRLDASKQSHNGIYLMAADGSGVQKVIDTPAGEDPSSEPTFSPDGTKILFEVSDSKLYVANADGSDSHVVVSTGVLASPDWSPDGNRIVFAGADDNLHLVNADGTNPVVLTHEASGLRALGPTWSSDGIHIAYSQTTAAGGCDIHAMDIADSSDQLILTVTGCARGEDWGL